MVLAVVLAASGCCLGVVDGYGSGGLGGSSSTTGPICPSVSNGSSAAATFAGNGAQSAQDGTGGPQGSAEFEEPDGVAVDSSGNVFVVDTGYNRICKADSSGKVVTLAGGIKNVSAFAQPYAIAIAQGRKLYVADTGNQRIQILDSTGVLIGSIGGSVGAPNEFTEPTGVAVDGLGNLYVADSMSNRIARVDPSGQVSTFAGNGQAGDADGSGGASGPAEFDHPWGIAVDLGGNLFVSDALGNRIRRVDPEGNVTTLAGNGLSGFRDGTGGPQGTAEFWDPLGIAVDACDNVYVVDSGNGRVRKIDPAGNVTTLTSLGNAAFSGANGVAVDASGNVYVADGPSRRVVKITP